LSCSHEGSVPPRPAYRPGCQFIIVVVSGCTATDRHLPPKSSALPAAIIPHRFGDERDEWMARGHFFFLRIAEQSGLMKQSPSAKSVPPRWRSSKPVESGQVQGGQAIDRRDYLVIAEVFRIGRRQIGGGRLGHVVHAFVITMPA